MAFTRMSFGPKRPRLGNGIYERGHSSSEGMVFSVILTLSIQQACVDSVWGAGCESFQRWVLTISNWLAATGLFKTGVVMGSASALAVSQTWGVSLEFLSFILICFFVGNPV